MIRLFIVLCTTFALTFIGLQQTAQASESSPVTTSRLSHVTFVNDSDLENGISFEGADGSGGVAEMVTAGGCGFLKGCIYFNRDDQIALAAGSSAVFMGLICVVGTPAACIAAGAVVAVAMTYISAHGLCPSSKKRLRVQWFPKVGAAACVS